MNRGLARLTCARAAVAGLAGCAGLNPRPEAGWVAFHDCQPVAPSAAMEDLLVSGRVNALSIGTRPHTHCYPQAG